MTLRTDRLEADVRVIAGERRLILRGRDLTVFDGFDGGRHDSGDHRILEGALTAANAAALREAFPHLRPRPLGTGTSAGVGDRLGLATEGHVAAFARYGCGVTPVFAQQSIREMDRLNRSPRSVIDDATFGCVAGGWTGAVGADLDHIRTIGDLDRGIEAGYTTFTLDPGDAIPDAAPADLAQAVASVDWGTLEDRIEAVVGRYAGVAVDLGARSFSPTEDDVRRAVAKYADAVALTVRMSRHLASRNSSDYEIEIAVDETARETSLFEHHYIASELHRLGVRWVSLAPRYVDGFEKGLDYLGDADRLVQNFADHRAIADLHGGYKISMHSGSDKFSVYAALVEATQSRIHLKTSGTTWLAAVGIVARRDPALFREIYRLSQASYRDARSSYQVSADVDRTPVIESVSDDSLPDLVEMRDSRQILHVGYGTVLTAVDESGNRTLDPRIRDTVTTHRDEYALILESHLGRHLAPFSERPLP